MRSKLECLVCMHKQALNSVRLATDDPVLQREVLDRVAESIRDADLNRTPAEVSHRVYEIVSEVTGISDPYKRIKAYTNQEALKMLPDLRSLIDEARDSIQTGAHIAVAGNIIDIGIGHMFDLKKDVLAILKRPFSLDDLNLFKKKLRRGQKLLYIGDNSGEIVFDRLFVEEILKTGTEILFCVKSKPIINDATLEDARAAGLIGLVKVIETGSGDVGINFKNSGDEFKEAFENADIILAKGHGNFETLNEVPRNIFFLLKAKCDVVADELGVNLGEIVFAHQRRFQSTG